MLPAVPTFLRGVLFKFMCDVSGWSWVAFANSFCFASFKKLLSQNKMCLQKCGGVTVLLGRVLVFGFRVLGYEEKRVRDAAFVVSGVNYGVSVGGYGLRAVGYLGSDGSYGVSEVNYWTRDGNYVMREVDYLARDLNYVVREIDYWVRERGHF